MKDGANKKLLAIRALEEEIKNKKSELAELRRKSPPAEIKDHDFQDSFGKKIRLSDLFGDKKELILVHNMGPSCPYCTMWADGFNGIVKHLEDRAAFVVESPEDPAKQRQFAADRGWVFRMVCSKGSTFRKEMGYMNDKGFLLPGVSVFTKDAKGKICRASAAGFGPGDNFSIVWDFFDLLPSAWTGEEGDYNYSKIR